VSNLQIGVYQFELTVTDSMGMSGKDTIKVTVSQMSSNANEILLENQTWIFPWYSAIESKISMT
jgi:K319L-like, PKD domain